VCFLFPPKREPKDMPPVSLQWRQAVLFCPPPAGWIGKRQKEKAAEHQNFFQQQSNCGIIYNVVLR
jgi:hypothetical protein